MLIGTWSYTEGIEYLYSQNFFTVTAHGGPPSTFLLLSLPQFILPQRLCQIRYLDIYWEVQKYIFGDYRSDCEWFSSWDVLSQMTGLKKLFIKLNAPDFDPYLFEKWKQREVLLLETVKRVLAPKNFVVVLPYRRCRTDLDVGHSRCEFRLPGAWDSCGGLKYNALDHFVVL